MSSPAMVSCTFLTSKFFFSSSLIFENTLVNNPNSVLNPMAPEVMPDPSATTQAPAFSGATPVQDAPFTAGITPTATLTPATMSVNAGHLSASIPTTALFGIVGGAAVLLANL